MKTFTQNKLLVSLVAILLFANLGFLLYSFVYKKDEHKRPALQEQLNLSKEQTKQLETLREKHKEEIRPVMEEMQRLKDSLYGTLKQPGTNDSTVYLLAEKVGQKQKQIELMFYEHFAKVRALCNDEQKSKFDSILHKMMTRGPWMKKRSGDKKSE